jgi:hypothetical protein
MNPFYHEAMVRYLAFLAFACLIASCYAGRGVILVWLVTAIILYFIGRAGIGGPPAPPRCPRNRRTRR